MEQENTYNSIPLLIACGALLFIVGALVTYIFVSPQLIEVTADPNVQESDIAKKDDPYSWQAPENYEAEPPVYADIISLPEPDVVGSMPVETALQARRTVRSFSEESLSIDDVSQMLWAGIGVTGDDGKRTAPSRGGENPTRLFLVVDNVTDLEPGLYEYLEDRHALGVVRKGDHSSEWESITHQPYPMNAPAVILISGDMYKQYYRYGDTSERLVLQESGHIGQNLYLQAETRGLGLVVMGGFDTVAGQQFLGTLPNEPVVYLVPFGHRGE